jgi:hypothetical protein
MTTHTFLLHDHCSIKAIDPAARMSDQDIQDACKETPLWVKQTLEKAFYPDVASEDLCDHQKCDLLVGNSIVWRLLVILASGEVIPWDGMFNSYDWQEPRQLSFFMNLRDSWVELFDAPKDDGVFNADRTCNN